MTLPGSDASASPPAVSGRGERGGRSRPDRPGFLLRLLASSRFFVGLAVVGSFLSAVTILVYGVVAVVEIAWDTLRQGDVSVNGAKYLSVALVELTDVFLLGTVLMIVALGLCELFIEPDLPLPAWLRIDDLEELKVKLIGVIVVLLAVTFLGFVVEWNGEERILELGVAVAVVIAALSFLIIASTFDHKSDNDSRPQA